MRHITRPHARITFRQTTQSIGAVAASLLFVGCGGGGPLAADEPCPAFDAAALTDLSFLDADSGVVIEGWNSEADRFVGLCTDEVRVALDEAGISYTVSGDDEAEQPASYVVHLVSDGRRITGATRS